MSFTENLSRIFTSTPKENSTQKESTKKRKAEENTGASPEEKKVLTEHTPSNNNSENNESNTSSDENSFSDGDTDSTVKSEDSTNTVLSKILNKLSDLSECYKSLIKSDTFNTEKFKDTEQALGTVKRKLVQQHETITKLELENARLRRSKDVLTERIDSMERDLKRNNLIFSGFKDANYNDRHILIRSIHSCLNNIAELNGNAHLIPIKDYYRIGYYNPSKLRELKIEFQHRVDVDMILAHKNQLPPGVYTYVREDLPENIEKRRQKMLKVYLYAKKLENYRRKCRMELDTLVIKGVTYTVETMHNLPEDLKPHVLCEERNKNIVAFLGDGSPLSNFYHCEVEYEGFTYSSVEQVLQSEKADHYDDQIAHAKILHSEDPAEIKRVGKHIPVIEQHWSRESVEIVRKACRNKFLQHQHLQDYLLATEDRVLVEASTDKKWGCGLHLRNKDILNSALWSGDNQLGKILMEIRDELNTSKQKVKAVHQDVISEIKKDVPKIL